MSIARSLLTRGTAYLTYNSHNFFTKDKIVVKQAPVWDKVMTSMFGPVDAWKKDNIYKIGLRLWGAWENLGDVFPSYLMNPIPGTSVFGTSDKPFGIQARNNDLLTFTNAAITGMSGLYLGVDSDLFAADVEVTCLLGNSMNPESSGAYHVISSNAYSDATAAFAETNYKRVRFTAAWGSITGFTALTPQKGIQVGWGVSLKPVPVDGLGTVDMSVQSMIGTMKMIGIGPTLAQLKTNSQEETKHGTLGSTISADLTATGDNSGPVVTLKSAYLKEYSRVFDSEDLRTGEATWEGTRFFSTGAPAVAASVA